MTLSPAQSPNAGGQNLVFISYSHADAKWLTRLRVHLKPLERHGVIVPWDDTKIKPGTQWREEIRNALERARVAVLLVSADFLASDFIATNELPPLLQAAEAHGTLVLPLILDHCRFEKTDDLSRFQAVNDPSKPLATLDRSHREAWFNKLGRTIEEALMATSRKPDDDTNKTNQSEAIRSVLLDIFPDECILVGKTNLNDIVKLRGRVQFAPMAGATHLDFAVPLALLVTAAAILGHASTIANTWRDLRDTKKLVFDISISLPGRLVGKLEPQILENMLTLFVERLLQDRARTSELRAEVGASLVQSIDMTFPSAELQVGGMRDGKELARASHHNLNIEEATVASEPRKLKVFISYAHEDEHPKAALEQRLKSIGRYCHIESLSDPQILAGAPVHDDILTRLRAADVMLLLISPAFVASDYCWTREMEIALEQYERAGKLVVPIIVRRTPAWSESKIGRHLSLPKDGRPLFAWLDADEFWSEVEEGLRCLFRDRLGKG